MSQGQLPPSSLDTRDGFIHLSTASQLDATLSRHFRGREDLLLLTIDSQRLIQGSLRFEAPERGGPDYGDERFPHFYGEVCRDAILMANALTPDERGTHPLPREVARVADQERERESLGMWALQMRLVWDADGGIALLEYPRKTRIEDEAGMLAWEAELEGRLARLTNERGKIPLVIGVDNLWVAPKLVRHYRDLSNKLTSRAFARVARWSQDERTRRFFAHHNSELEAPSQVFTSRLEAIAFVQARPQP